MRVQVLEYLREKTRLPVPHVTSWGLTNESPRNLGPFIIMNHIDGTSLTTLLKQPVQSEEDDIILRDDMDDDKLGYVYEQLAEFMIELSRLDFDAIGAIAKNPDTNQWLVVQRHLQHERIDGDRVKLSCGHLSRCAIPNHSGPSNMLADPETLKVNAILDWEFTHAMPAQFTYDPPWWLILKGPDIWLGSYNMEAFLARYEPRLEQFLRAFERVEARSPPTEPRLSTQMRESWKSGQFWADYGIRKSLDVDDIFWGAIHREGDEVLDEEQQRAMEGFVETRMKDLEAYDVECKERGL
ncbi:hypothetical protein J1614_011426 [Plenodomus biglobosus]|nr:hypothetical protein J1614_011426 [Plenodomus biglobosus]